MNAREGGGGEEERRGVSTCEWLDIFFEFLELVVENRLEDSSDLRIGREGEVNEIEFALRTSGDLRTATAGWAHGSDELNIDDLLEDIASRSIEPAFVVHPLAEEFKGRLTAELVLSGHVEIVDEDDHFLAVGNHFVLGSSDQLRLDHFLCLERVRLRGEHDVHRRVGFV